ncbi:MAG: BrnT family toxin [Rhodanobacteraceae bacterium]
MYVWNDEKRKANLAKHGLDFADAYLVYENPEKVTLVSPRHDEARRLDVALVNIGSLVLALTYIERGEDIRVISFRRASRTERRRYAQSKKSD